jgi:transposase-like protein
LPRPKKSFSPEFKDEAVKMVIETSRPIARVAKELGINEGTLGNWVGIYRREHAGEEPPLTCPFTGCREWMSADGGQWR